MIPDLFYSIAIAAVFAHLFFNFWVVFGAAFTKDRPGVEKLHILSLVYGAVMENGPWPCPLTLLQQWGLTKAGAASYQGAFLVHYLNEVVAPHFPVALLGWGAIGVCLVNLGIYVHRHLKLRREALQH
jgi:Protein of Unknown function (DUF2784)